MIIYYEMQKGKCPICNSECEYQYQDDIHCFYKCPTCGRFKMDIINNYEGKPNDKNKLSSYLYYNGLIEKPLNIKDEKFFNYIGNEIKYKEINEEYPWAYHVTNDKIENWYPRTFADKVDTFLLCLSKQSKFLGDIISLTTSKLFSATFVKRYDDIGNLRNHDECVSQANFLIQYLIEQDYIEPIVIAKFTLKTNGYKRIDELQKDQVNNSKTVFVAMSFAKEMESTKLAIENAITETGYLPIVMNEIQHNNQIVPEMLYQIRKAKFVIADLTKHNNGAYFEEGYALGLGKEVIQLCKENCFSEDGHFDVKQLNTILWDTPSQLTDLLIKRIVSTIGKSENNLKNFKISTLQA